MKQFLTAILIILSLSTQAQIFFYDDCEGASDPVLGGNNQTTTWAGRHVNTNATLTRSTAYARAGSYSYRHTLTNSTNDTWDWMKSELFWNFLPAGSPLGVVGDYTAYYRNPIGIRWFAFSTLIPASNTDYNTITGIGMNTKSVEDDYTTPSFLAMELGRYVFWITPVNASNQALTQIKYDCGPVVKDVWVDWVMNRNYTSKDSGYVRLYKDGQLIVEYLGGNWKDDPAHSKEPYIQQGIYKWSFSNNWSPVPNVNFVEMYTDEFRFGHVTATLADMSPGGAAIPNQSPSTYINSPVTTTLDSTQILAVSSDADGTISSSSWALQSGPNTPTITLQLTDTLKVSGLINGTYVYRYIVTDNDAASDTAYVSIIKSSPVAGVGLIFSNGAEATGDPVLGGTSPDISNYFSSRVGVTTNTLTKTSDQARIGNNSYRFVLVNSATTGYLYTDNELTWNYIPSSTPVGIKWQGISIYPDSSNVGDNTPTTIGINALVSPTVDPKTHWMEIVNGEWIFVHQKYNSGGTLTETSRNNLGSVSYGNWTDWAVERNYSLSADTSYIRVYKNKAQVYEYTGPNYNPSGLAPEPYFQIGIWKPAYDTAAAPNKDSVVYHIDEIRFADYETTTVDDVSPNQYPVVTVNGKTVTTDATTITALATDADGTISSYNWVQLSGPATATISGASSATASISGMITNGDYLFQVSAVDNLGDVGSQLVTVTRSATFNNLPQITVNEIGYKEQTQSVIADISATDVEDGTTLTYAWYQISGPSTAITNPTTSSPTFETTRSGTYIFQVDVTDTQGGVSSAIVEFEIFNYLRKIRFKPGRVKVVLR